jgi:hypothetical protein
VKGIVLASRGMVRASQGGKGIVRTSSGEKKRMNIVFAQITNNGPHGPPPAAPFLATALVL